MKPTPTIDIFTSPNFIKFTALALLSLSLLFFTHRFFFSSTATTTTTFSVPLQPPPHVLPPPLPPPPRRNPVPEVVRTGIVDETGAMSWNFEVGEFYVETDSVGEELDNVIAGDERDVKKKERRKGRVVKYKVCEDRLRDYIPCLDNEREITRVDKCERHCPLKVLECLVPPPKGYKTPIPWPQSRDQVWLRNVPKTPLVEGKRGQKNWVKVKGDKFIFQGGEAKFPNGADKYLDQISQMVPEIAFGHHIRVALDVDCGLASFGAYLMQRNITTLSIALKDVHENQIQFALERGVPAMVAVFARQRLLYPSQAFDFIHCSRCRVNWTHDDGILLLEANRMLRAGGYFAWAVETLDKDGEILLEKQKDMEDLAARICWELVKKDGNIAVWRKPLNNSCYINRAAGVQPPICDSNDDLDNVWYVGLRACIALLPENSYGVNITTWPARLHLPPDRLQSIKMDADISRKEIYRADSKYWNDIIVSYVRAFRWKEMKLRNVMDMRAGLGGFAAALHDLQIDCWVMNVVPVSGFNTLPVLYDRGLIGVMHDWCEPFDTYPRTYDLLHAAGLFSVEQNRNKCDISLIMLEMDRMLRPGGHVYIRDLESVIVELQEIAIAMGWTPALHETGEGPHASWKILICEKRM
ncbi:probable methyltransferase PMT10 [Pistacia vera]|uniref:probable methyltransferase PMT10 n=1 Tax=Pistacia vera TaxID=55513 RepID=UPI0012632265|nr:probable methyltransferase PMT10 [Pistacia vera]